MAVIAMMSDGRVSSIAWLVITFAMLCSSQSTFSSQDNLLPRGSCRYRSRNYVSGQRFTFTNQDKRFDCVCEQGRLSCSWIQILRDAKCYDSVSRSLKDLGQKWERIANGRTYDCVCDRASTGMQVTCSDENRCFQDDVSYKRGDRFTSMIGGREMRCECLARKKVSCRYEENLPGPETDSQLIENFIVTGGRVLRPQITTLQACRTGSKVLTSGAVWNQTKTNALGYKTLEECTCADAIVRCRTVRLLEQIESYCTSIDGKYRKVGDRWIKESGDQEFICKCYGNNQKRCRRTSIPHCVDETDGKIRAAGHRWKRVHETISTIKFSCTCHSNKTITCEDIGTCDEPPAPANGALLCANVGRAGREQAVYCAPLCLAGYEFINPQRYYRPWEVCGQVNLHRWSGGFIGDPDAIARCVVRRGGRQRGHSNLYLPTDDCDSLTTDQIESEKNLFLRRLRYRNLCDNKCEITTFKCGEKDD